MQTCVDAICGYLDWPVGHFYTFDPDDSAQLISSSVWHIDDSDDFDAFRKATEALRFRSGLGLPGRVLATGRPASIADLSTDDNFPRQVAATAAGLRCAVGFPVLVGAEVVGVLEFFSLGTADLAPTILDVMAQIGTQLGRVVERTRAATVLLDNEARMRLVVETAGDAFIAMDANGMITDWNAAAATTFGWSREEIIGCRLSDTIIPLRYRQAHDQGLTRFLATGKAAVFGNRLELEALHRDGHEVPMELSIWPVGEGHCVQFNAFVHDITERRQAETALFEAKEKFQRAFDDAPIGMVLVDLDGRIFQANRSYCEMMGYGEDALLTMTVEDLTHPDDIETTREMFDRAVKGELATYRLEKRHLHAKGHTVFVQLSVSAVAGQDGVSYFIGQIEDISARKTAERKLIRQALHDPLTGVPNRFLLIDRLHQAHARCQRGAGAITVMFIDLDDFKRVNDSLGHHAGDRVLCMVAERLAAAVRPEDTVCRLGGDEFVVLCEGLGVDAELEAMAVAERVKAAVCQPCELGEETVIVTGSVGLVIARPGHGTPEGLIRDADTAMYRAKLKGRGELAGAVAGSEVGNLSR